MWDLFSKFQAAAFATAIFYPVETARTHIQGKMMNCSIIQIIIIITHLCLKGKKHVSATFDVTMDNSESVTKSVVRT